MKRLIVLFILASCASTGTTTPGTTPKDGVAGGGVVKCVTADAASLIALVAQFGAMALAGTVKDGKPNWDALVDAAIAEGVQLGGCAFVALYHAYDKVEPEAAVRSLSIQVDPRRAALDRLRAQTGAKGWQVPDGSVVR